MKTLFILLTSLCFAQNIPEVLEHKSTKAAVIMHGTSGSVIVIDPKARATDLAQAFNILRKDKPSLRITVATTNGILNGVMELQASEGGTLILIKTLSTQGSQTTIIPVEQIMEIGYTP